MRWLRSHGGTAAATVLGLLLTAPYAVQGIRSVTGNHDDEIVRDSLVFIGRQVRGPEAANAVFMTGLILVAASAVAVIALIGIALRREWAREAGMVIFGVFGLVSTLVSLSGLNAEPPAPRAGLGLLTGIGCFVVLALLLLPSTARLFSRREHEISQRRAVRTP